MQTLITIIHVFAAIFLIIVVLLQSGKGGGMGAFGGSNTNVFGARGAGNFLTKMTAVCAVVFFLTSLTLSIMSSKVGSVVQDVKAAPLPGPPSDSDLAAPPSTDVAPTNAPSSQPAK